MRFDKESHKIELRKRNFPQSKGKGEKKETAKKRQKFCPARLTLWEWKL